MQHIYPFEISPTMTYDNWKVDGRWLPYKFNYNGAPDAPRLLEVNRLENYVFGFRKIDHFIVYMMLGGEEGEAQVDAVAMPDTLFLLNLSTTNSAHSISELISFVNFYHQHGLQMPVAVPSIIADDLPHMLGLLKMVMPEGRVIVLDANKTYRVGEMLMRRNGHFNAIEPWQSIPYERRDDLLVFRDLQSTAGMFTDDPGRVMEAARQAFELNRHRFPRQKTVMLAKTVGEGAMTTPGRALTLTPDVRTRLEHSGIRILSLAQMSTEEYLATLYGAERLVTSYGGAACTNRFFLNPDAKVLLLANRHYHWEYTYPHPDGEFWHIIHSHLFPVARQTVVLDHNDELTLADVDRIDRLLQFAD